MTGPERVARQVGASLRRLRERRSGGQADQIAEAAGISCQELVAFEEGQEQPSTAALAAVLQALRCTADEFGQHLGPWGVVRSPR